MKCRRDQHQRLHPLGMPQGKAGGGLGPRGHGHDDGPGHLVGIQHRRQHFGLGGVGGVGRHGAAEIPEPGGGDEVVVVPEGTHGGHQCLVEPTTCAVHDQHGRSAAGLGHLHRAKGGLHQPTLGSEPRARSPHVRPERGADRRAGPGCADSKRQR
jgi:hypothetical protein